MRSRDSHGGVESRNTPHLEDDGESISFLNRALSAFICVHLRPLCFLVPLPITMSLHATHTYSSDSRVNRRLVGPRRRCAGRLAPLARPWGQPGIGIVSDP